MFSTSQINLLVLSLLLTGAAVFIFFFYLKGKQHETRYPVFLKYFAPVLFILLISIEVSYFIYYSKFLYYFGISAAILILVSFTILAIPVIGLLRKERLHFIGLGDFLKRKQIEEQPLAARPIEIKPEEKVPEVIKMPDILIDEKKELEPVETGSLIPIHVKKEHLHKESKKAEAKKTEHKITEHKKTEIKKEETKHAEAEHVKPVHPKTKQTKTAAIKTKHPGSNKPKRKK